MKAGIFYFTNTLSIPLNASRSGGSGCWRNPRYSVEDAGGETLLKGVVGIVFKGILPKPINP